MSRCNGGGLFFPSHLVADWYLSEQSVQLNRCPVEGHEVVTHQKHNTPWLAEWINVIFPRFRLDKLDSRLTAGRPLKMTYGQKMCKATKENRHLTEKAESKLKPVEIPSSGFTTLSQKVCQIKRTNKPCNKTLPSRRSRVHPGQVPIWMSDTLSSNISLAALW